ncbi:YycH family regulatory protein, partial [Lactiplantibacillus pentosus]
YHNLQKIVSSNQVEQTPVELKRMNSKYVSFYSSKVRIQQYSYLANKDNASTFVTRLMGASNASINSRREDQETVYFDNSGQRIAVKNDT